MLVGVSAISGLLFGTSSYTPDANFGNPRGMNKSTRADLEATTLVSSLGHWWSSPRISATPCPTWKRLVYITFNDHSYRLRSDHQEIITSSTTLGALLGGLASGALSDYTGRKPVIALASAVFVLGAMGQAVSIASET